jgi:hypothetical protein
VPKQRQYHQFTQSCNNRAVLNDTSKGKHPGLRKLLKLCTVSDRKWKK